MSFGKALRLNENKIKLRKIIRSLHIFWVPGFSNVKLSNWTANRLKHSSWSSLPSKLDGLDRKQPWPEKALARAKELDGYLTEHKRLRGPLHGLPISV